MVKDRWLTATVAGMIFAVLLTFATLQERSRTAPANERDWDHVNDFWGGVRELYQYTGSVVEEESPD